MPGRQPNRWEYSFEDSAKLRDRDKAARRRHPQPAAPQDEDTGDECARGEWCTSKVVTIIDGKRVTRPKRSPRPFCDGCCADLAAKVDELPGLYALLERELRAPASVIRGRYGKLSAPAMPLRGDVDALMRQMTEDLTAWWNRVVEAARLTELAALDPERWHRDGHGRVCYVADRLAEATHLGALIARPAEWMIRRVAIPPHYDADATPGADYLPSGALQRPRPGAAPVPRYVLDRYPGATLVNIGVDWVTIRAELDGRHAGLDLVHVHYRCRSVLGLTRPRPEELLAVACYECQLRTLVRADPPRDTAVIAYWSRCKACGHRMTEPEYRQHVDRLAAARGGPKRPAPEPCPAG